MGRIFVPPGPGARGTLGRPTGATLPTAPFWGRRLEPAGWGAAYGIFTRSDQMSDPRPTESSGEAPPAAETPFTVYCLRSTASRRTYVGATVDLSRRLRQHNGELVGGAKYTAGHRPWEVALAVRGFSTFREALQFEWRWKKTRVRRAGLAPLPRREEALAALLAKKPWVDRPVALRIERLYSPLS